jgi:NhaP-type Na+/H+ or K+/H+ antiporter
LARVLRLFRAEVYLPLLSEIPTREPGAGVFLRVAEVGLVLLLFTRASRTKLWVLRRIEHLSRRLLTAGLLLTIALGTAAALAVLGKMSIYEAGILAAIPAPRTRGWVR